MAGPLSRTLLRHSTTRKPPPLTQVYLHHRQLSSKPSAQLYELVIEEESERSSIITKLEDAVNHVMLLRSTPDWVPFIPGSSFWVPPNNRPVSLSQIVNNLSNTLSHEESLSLATCRGFPSSRFYLPSLPLPPDNSSAKITVVQFESFDKEMTEREEGEEMDSLADEHSEEG